MIKELKSVQNNETVMPRGGNCAGTQGQKDAISYPTPCGCVCWDAMGKSGVYYAGYSR